MHNQGKRYVGQGRTLILIGHAGHPEVEGTMGQIAEPVTLVQTENDVASLDIPADTPVAYVTQTTLSVDDTRGIIAALQEPLHRHRRAGDARHLLRDAEPPDRCARTSKLVDVILVVGAKNSSNSNRLREIGEEDGTPSYLIADGSEVEPDWFDGAKTVGITAGASAPEVLVEDVIDALRRLGPVEVSELTGTPGNHRVPPAAGIDRRQRLAAGDGKV